MADSIDANAFLDPEAFAETLGIDDEINLPAGFFERALTQLHAKGYGSLARRAERHEDRYIRRLRQNAWNFDYFNTIADARAELGLWERPTPLGPTAGKGSWEQLGGYTQEAKRAQDWQTQLEVIKTLEGRATLAHKIKKSNEILDAVKWHADSRAELTLAIEGFKDVNACFLPFERLARDSDNAELKAWAALIMRCSCPIGRVAIEQSYALTAECINQALLNANLWKNSEFLHEDDTLIAIYTCPGDAEISIMLRQKPTTDEWYVYIKGCYLRMKVRSPMYALEPMCDYTLTDSMDDTTYEFDFDSADDKQKDKFLAKLGDQLAEWFGGEFCDVNVDDVRYMPLAIDAMDEASKLYEMEWGYPDVTKKDEQSTLYARLQLANDYLTKLLNDEAGYVIPEGEMRDKIIGKEYDYTAVFKGADE